MQKTAEATGDLIGKSLTELLKVQKFTKEYSETNEEGILRERFIPTELRHKIIKDIRLKKKILMIKYNNRISKNNKFIRWYNESTI